MTGFIGQALVFIGSAVVLVPIFHRLGLGSVVGYLIAGILVGPNGLKLIHDSDSVIHFSELGVVLLLFLIGIEIQPQRLWTMRRELFGLGGLQVVAASVLFGVIGWILGLSPVASGVVGFSLSLSSTAFAVQTLNDRNQFKTEFGRVSFSVLLMQDLLAIPALAVIPLLGVEIGAQKPMWQTIVGAIVIILALIVSSRFLIRPVFRVIANTRSREIFTAATLFIVLGVAALMQRIGLSAALGTFIAGVLLADSEYRHELETNLEPFKSLLMGLFFIAVGMGVSVDLIAEKPLLILALALAYIAGKWIVIYFVGRVFRMSHENSKLMAISIAQGGEFAFVIFGISLQSKLASSDTLALLTAVITISMAASPLLNLANDALDRLRFADGQKRGFDEIKDEAPEVILAGFGRFGQIFGRVLRAQSIPFVAIDHDSDQIELVRRFGNKVYYGDASRRDLLESAGAAKAKYFILAIDDIEDSLETVKVVKEHFPHLKIFARARNRGHAFDLMALDVHAIKRETFDASVYFVRDLLVDMGFTNERANRLIERFKRHDELMLLEQFKVRDDDKNFVSISKQGTAQLAQVLSDDNLQTHI